MDKPIGQCSRCGRDVKVGQPRELDENKSWRHRTCLRVVGQMTESTGQHAPGIQTVEDCPVCSAGAVSDQGDI